MSRIDHEEHPTDAAVMLATRAYLAMQPKLAIAPEARGPFDEFMATTPAADDVEFEPTAVNGVEGWWVIPANHLPDVAQVHFHGGAYVIGSAASYRNFVSQLAHRSGIRTFVPEYALAPERPFPEALEDAQAAVEGLFESSFQKLVLSGDSAGGGLALAVTQLLMGLDGRHLKAVKGVLALSPWTDLSLTAGSLKERAESDPILTRDDLYDAAIYYAGMSADRRDARLSPRFGELQGLPPVMIHVGADEILLDDAVGFGAAVQLAGSPIEVHVWKGMTHVFPASVLTLQAAREALDLSAVFVRGCLEGPRK